MKNIGKLFGMAMLLIFVVGTTSSCSASKYRSPTKKKRKKRCNCPTFSATEVISLEEIKLG